ncbi:MULTISPECIES: hypothetical protein [Klebsiella]|uniref:hypothetical protein n=1 Tax=Klebsiella TaxID=570 RepID=UPI000B4107EC|nr:hypothetical protein [Klebsiella pasteurii]MDX7162102.1 hypothetical protein [Klebsiella pasteurii]OVU33381.1 hypothetical protein BME18_19015 [Klebsiella michiganensis]
MYGFFQTPVIYSGNDLPVIPESDIERYEVIYEADAYEHWALNGSNSSLTGMVNRKVLTRVGDITAADGIFSMQVNTTAKLGLKSDKADSRVQTQCAVIRVDSTPSSSSSASILMGTLNQSAGSAVYIDENPFIRRQFRPTISITGEKSATGLANKWLFVGFSENGTASGMISTVLVGGDSPSIVTKDYAQAKTVSTNYVSVGPIDYSASTGGTAVKLDVAEYIVYDKALSPSQLLAVYIRSKTRLANRGFMIE